MCVPVPGMHAHAYILQRQKKSAPAFLVKMLRYFRSPAYIDCYFINKACNSYLVVSYRLAILNTHKLDYFISKTANVKPRLLWCVCV